MTSLHKPGLRRRLGLNSYCGDGVLNGPEECDLGQGNTADDGDVSGCSSYCTRPHYCGDGVLDDLSSNATTARPMAPSVFDATPTAGSSVLEAGAYA